MMKYVITLALIGAVAFAAPAKESSIDSKSLVDEAFDVYSSCGGQEALSVCLKMKALRMFDRAARSADIPLIDGLHIVKADDVKTSRADNARSLNDIESTLPVEVEAREAAVDEALLDRASRFLASHTLEVSSSDMTEDEGHRSVGEARGKKKKVLKSLLPLLLLLKVKAIFLIPILLGGLALLAFKALVIGKIALIISGILALQKLLANKGQQSYEVVAHPVANEEHHGWGRSAVVPSDLAYNAYKPTN